MTVRSADERFGTFATSRLQASWTSIYSMCKREVKVTSNESLANFDRTSRVMGVAAKPLHSYNIALFSRSSALIHVSSSIRNQIASMVV